MQKLEYRVDQKNVLQLHDYSNRTQRGSTLFLPCHLSGFPGHPFAMACFWPGHAMATKAFLCGFTFKRCSFLNTVGRIINALTKTLTFDLLFFHLRLDALSAVFLFLLGMTSFGVSVYAVGYFRRNPEAASPYFALCYHLFWRQ